VKRNPNAVFDPWDHVPTAVISDLTELPGIHSLELNRRVEITNVPLTSD